MRVGGHRFDGKPLRVAAWMDDRLDLIAAAIVDGHGNALMRRLLDEQLATTPVRNRPRELVVWPSVEPAVRDVRACGSSSSATSCSRCSSTTWPSGGRIFVDLPVRAA